jgi:hypothetical protein
MEEPKMTMEQVFIRTGIWVLLIGIGLGFLVEWIFRKENEEGEDGK